MSPLSCLVLAERKGRLLLYQLLLRARSFRHFPFDPHSFSETEAIIPFPYLGPQRPSGVTW